MHAIVIRHRTVLIFLLLIGMVVYANSFTVPFHYDDYHFLKENLNIKSPAMLLNGIAETPSSLVTGRPVLILTFLVNYQLGGLDTFGYHLINILIHVANAFVLYLILFQHAETDRQRGYSVFGLIAALLFLVHPIATESVTYLSSRSSSLSALFTLASLWTFFRATGDAVRPGYYAASLALFLLALSTKQTAVVLPGLLLLFDFIYVSRGLRPLLARMKYHLPFFLVVLALATLYLPFAVKPEAPRPWSMHILTEFTVLIEYLKLLLMPVGLNIDHDVLPATRIDSLVMSSFFVITALGGAAIALRKKQPAVSFGIIWFMINMAPFFIIRLNDFMAERWVYAASAGFSVALAGLLHTTVSRYRRVGIALTALIIVVAGVLTIMRNQVYADPVALWEDAARKGPDNYRPYSNLARSYRERGDIAMAIRMGEESLKRAQGRVLVKAHINLAAAYSDLGNFAKAEELLLVVESHVTDQYEFHHNLGAINIQRGKFTQAIAHLKKALELRPASPTLLYLIGSSHENLAQGKEAKRYYEQAANSIAQTGPEYINKGVSHFKLGNPDRAMDCFIEAVKADPLDANIRLYLAHRFYSRGAFDQAFHHYTVITKISPGFGPAYAGMGLVMMQKNDFPEAERYFTMALDLLRTNAPEREEILQLLKQVRG